jgi:hypothetical protein
MSFPKISASNETIPSNSRVFGSRKMALFRQFAAIALELPQLAAIMTIVATRVMA